METRTLCHEIRSESAENSLRFSGYAAVFDTWSGDLGGFREKIDRGAFKKTLSDGDDVRALFNHDPNYVLGRTKAGTLTLSEDERGLKFEIDAPDIAWARDLHKSVERGDISQCSFSFMIEDEEWATNGKDLDERTIKGAKLYDVSIVTYPAYEATNVQARSRRRTTDALRRRLELKEKT